MRFDCGTRQKDREALAALADANPRHAPAILKLMDAKLGYRCTLTRIRRQHTQEQQNTFHWLLSQWLKMDPRLTCDLEQLKTQVLTAMWPTRVTLPGGQEKVIPLRRTTQSWSFDEKRYVPDPLSVELESELIDFTMNMASEDGIVLPQPEKQE